MITTESLTKNSIDTTIKSSKNSLEYLKNISDNYSINMLSQYKFIDSSINLLKSNYSTLTFCKSLLNQLISKGGNPTGAVYECANRNFLLRDNQYLSYRTVCNSWFDMTGDYVTNASEINTSIKTWTDSPNFMWNNYLIPQNVAIERINNGEHHYFYKPLENKISVTEISEGYVIFNVGHLTSNDEWEHYYYSLDCGSYSNAHSKMITDDFAYTLALRGWDVFYLERGSGVDDYIHATKRIIRD